MVAERDFAISGSILCIDASSHTKDLFVASREKIFFGEHTLVSNDDNSFSKREGGGRVSISLL
jgi:hypothetical protein